MRMMKRMAKKMKRFELLPRSLKPDGTNSFDLLSRKPDLCPVEMVLTTDMQQNRKTAGRKPERLKDDNDGTASASHV